MMRGRLATGLDRLGAACAAFGGIVLTAIVALTVVDVIGRYLFDAPLDGATELTEFGIALVVFAALPAVSWQGGHVVVDLFDSRTPPQVHRWREVAVDLVFALCLMILGRRIWEFAVRAARREEISEYLEVPLAWIFFYISVMCILTAFGLLARAYIAAGGEAGRRNIVKDI